MSGKNSVFICECELENGYIFKNFFAVSNVRARPVVTFLPGHILTSNRTADDQIYAKSYLHGDEIGLKWDSSIPIENRQLHLTFDALGVQALVGKIKKKDQARIFIFQMRLATDPNNFCGPNSTDEFILYFSSGTGGDRREGLRSIMATRSEPDRTEIKYPDPVTSSTLLIPIKTFKQMVESFTKCRKEQVKISYFSAENPGITINTEVGGQRGDIFEKYGHVPDNEDNVLGYKFDPSAIVRPCETGTRFVIQAPNEFTFDADKVTIFTKLASMHTEGGIRITYQEKRHLRIALRFGAFGETELCLHNSFAN